MTEDETRGFDHAWRYFCLHAQQRMTVFNFFVASAGLTLSGLAWTLAEGSRHWPLGIAAGIGAASLSFLFWRLDQRGAQLVKTAEEAMIVLEARLPPAAAVFTAEKRLKTTRAGGLAVPWTFGQSFRLLFAVVAIIGILGAVLTAVIGIDSRASHSTPGRETITRRPAPGMQTDERPMAPVRPSASKSFADQQGHPTEAATRNEITSGRR